MEPTRGREQALGLNSAAAVVAAATVVITARPQIVFRPDRFVVAATIAASFTINDLRIGKNSQFVSGGGISAEIYSSIAVGTKMKLDTCQTGQDVTLNITNTSGAALQFFSALIGPSIE
jgi:hypothetical protein